MGVWVDKDEMDAYSGESFAKVREVRYDTQRASYILSTCPF